MKIAAVTMMMMAGMAAQAGETTQARERTVAVCVVDEGRGEPLLRVAQGITSKMFAGIGVTIDWRHGLRDCPAQGIVVTLTYNTPKVLHPGTLAYAKPYEGTHIRLFCDRIMQYDRPFVLHLLAHVLAHEITHILQGIRRHSDRGVMKAQWDGKDYSHMIWRPLPFAEEDIDLIYRGLARRAAREMLAMNAAPVMVAAK